MKKIFKTFIQEDALLFDTIIFSGGKIGAQIEINPTADQPLKVTVTRAAGEKCERCWHWETDLGTNAEHPTLCARCTGAVVKSV